MSQRAKNMALMNEIGNLFQQISTTGDADHDTVFIHYARNTPKGENDGLFVAVNGCACNIGQVLHNFASQSKDQAETLLACANEVLNCWNNGQYREAWAAKKN